MIRYLLRTLTTISSFFFRGGGWGVVCNLSLSKAHTVSMRKQNHYCLKTVVKVPLNGYDKTVKTW